MPVAVFEEDPSLPVAPLWRRLAAIIYDAILMIAIWFVTTMVYMLIKGLIIGSDAMREIAEAKMPTSDTLLTLSLLFVTFLFFAYFWQKLGQTLGMQVWRIRIQTHDGKGINWRQSTLRFLGAAISFTLLGIGYLSVIWDREKMAWHDKLSGSRVVYVPPVNKNSKLKAVSK
jgi:uncharacterized RDD family membrane protein YckC